MNALELALKPPILWASKRLFTDLAGAQKVYFILFYFVRSVNPDPCGLMRIGLGTIGKGPAGIYCRFLSLFLAFRFPPPPTFLPSKEKD